MREEIKIYEMLPIALSDFKNQARRQGVLSDEGICKKLSVLIYHHQQKEILPNNKSLYKFGSFNMLVDEEKNLITMIYWGKSLKVPEELQNKLKESYLEIGLDSSGLNENR